MNCTTWPLRRTQIIDRRHDLQRPRTLCAALSVALVLTGGVSAHVQAAPVRYTFAVIAGTLQSPADEAPTQRLIDAIGRNRDMSFIVYDGNLKGAVRAAPGPAGSGTSSADLYSGPARLDRLRHD
jgi:hypothetical protein